MSSDASVTLWIDRLRAGDRGAAQPLWDRYFGRLVRLAYRRLRGAARAAADEEDVALSAFKSFCLAAEQGRFPDLRDRDDLWRLLVVITERKALNLRRDQARRKRGGGRQGHDPGPRGGGVADLPGREPTPLFAALMAEECRRLLGQLEGAALRRIALDKMEGFSNREIAARHSLAVRSVERKLALIRRTWEESLRGPESP